MSENWISFPNLGVTFNLNPVAFMVGSTEVKWSSIFIVISAIVGFLIYFKAIKKYKFEKGQVALVTTVTTFFALIGARLVFIIPTNLAAMDQLYYETGNYPDTGYFNTFYKMIAFWDKSYGGLNLFGGLIFGLIALAILCKLKKWSMVKYLDSVVFALPAAIAINALGYITGQNSFGKHSDSLIAMNGNLIQKWVDVLRMNDIARGGTPIGPNVKWIVGNPVSPTPIYEILGCLAVIFAVALLTRFMIFTGEKFLWSLGLYSLLRAFTESSRIDAILFWNMRLNVLFSVIAILACISLIIIIRWQVKEGRLRGVSLYIDPRKNNGFENDTFFQKVYRGEAADADSNISSTVAAGDADDVNSNTTLDVDSGEVTEVASVEFPTETTNRNPSEIPMQDVSLKEDENKFEPSEGNGQVWTSDETAGETNDNNN